MDTFNHEYATMEQRDLFPFLNSNILFGETSNAGINQSSPSNSESSPLSSPRQNLIYTTPIDGNLPANSIDPKSLLYDNDDIMFENHGIKRPRTESDEDISVDVAHMTAAEIKELKAKISPDDLKEIKKKRRKLKNRESAQLSRQRKKLYVDELEQKVDLIVAKNKDLVTKVTTLSTENKSLKEEVDRLQNLVKQSSALNSVFENVQNIKKNQQVSSNVKAAGVCLAIVLFSFGLFFNEPQANMTGAPNISPSAMGTLHPLESGNCLFSPDILATGTSSSSSVSRGARVLNSVNSGISGTENECESSEHSSSSNSNEPKSDKNCLHKNKHSVPMDPNNYYLKKETTDNIVPEVSPTLNTQQQATPQHTVPTPSISTSSMDPFGSVSGLARGLSSLSGSFISDFARNQIPSKKSHVFWAEAFKIAGNENEEASLLLVPLTSQNRMLTCGLDG